MQGVWAQNECDLGMKCSNDMKCFETKNKQKVGGHKTNNPY